MKISDVMNIKTKDDTSVINIEGVIGLPEYWEDDPELVTRTKEKMKAELQAIESIPEVNKIVLVIDSPGGSVNHAKSIYTALIKHKAVKYVEYVGDSASAATVIASAAKKENITIPSYITLLVHEARGGYGQTIKEKQDEINILKTLNKNIAQIYSNLNGQTVDFNLDLMSMDNGEGVLMTADEAKELGFVGNVQEIEQMAAFDKKEYKINYSNFQYNNLINLKQMGLFSKKKEEKQPEVKVFENKYAYTELKEGSTFKNVLSDDSVNGTFEIEGQNIEVENNKIVSAKPIESKSEDFDNFKNTYEVEKSEMVAKIEEQESELLEQATRIEELENKLNEAISGTAKVDLPESTMQTDNGNDVELSAAAKARLRQSEARKELLEERRTK